MARRGVTWTQSRSVKGPVGPVMEMYQMLWTVQVTGLGKMLLPLRWTVELREGSRLSLQALWRDEAGGG